MGKTTLRLLVSALIVMSVTQVFAVEIGSGNSVSITTEDFEPLVFQCDNRVVLDDNLEPGRRSEGGENLVERHHNYAFEGEQIGHRVLVVDKNGIEKVSDVFVTFDEDREANCQRIGDPYEGQIPRECNARIGEEALTSFESGVMDYYDCLFTVEGREDMGGEGFTRVEAIDDDGLTGVMDEEELWFLNPEIALAIDGDIGFEDVRPGTFNYGTGSVVVGNDAEEDSGVMMDMFMYGKDFFDSDTSGAKCPESNILKLYDPTTPVDGHASGIFYHAVSGAYTTDVSQPDAGGARGPLGAVRARDPEGYLNIGYGDVFTRPGFYDGYEILNDKLYDLGTEGAPCTGFGCYSHGNVLSPGAEATLRFLLVLPEPCNGDFDTGQIFFWGEAV